ncbi:conserved Plasmodium protein, unknown function [Plasmodium vinckei lentum]|uniref:Uncharacterized protein n=1 Tax=Plasmodium vinckei lentum TaxID=138297 RepID=A0A6V7RXL3_PLAVN|nr:conserved Plasmodium protein, unknown function [Plasmodium vinckei lentum]
MNFLRLLTNEKPKTDEKSSEEKNGNNNDEANNTQILKDHTQPNENNKTLDPEKDANGDKEIKTNENGGIGQNGISNDSSAVDNNIKEKYESQNDKIKNGYAGEKRKFNNPYGYHNNEDKLSEDEEEKDFEYYYKKTTDFINTEFFGVNDEIKDIANSLVPDSKSSTEIDKVNIRPTTSSPDKYILEKMPFCKLINFEKNISTERQRVLNYYNEDRKQIYESSINKERQFSHIFQNSEKYYDAKEILAFLLPYHTFYLDHINIDEDDEDAELINNTEKEMKEIEQSIEEIRQSFVAYINPSIVWSLSRIADRTNHQYKKSRKICD